MLLIITLKSSYLDIALWAGNFTILDFSKAFDIFTRHFWSFNLK